MHHARTPRAAAVAGILFSILFSCAMVLVLLVLPADFADPAAWTEQGRSFVSISMGLMPLAGLAFLWFIGVVRDRLGPYEDQFFAEVFQGSGLLFLAMARRHNRQRADTAPVLDRDGTTSGSYAPIGNQRTRAMPYRRTHVYATKDRFVWPDNPAHCGRLPGTFCSTADFTGSADVNTNRGQSGDRSAERGIADRRHLPRRRTAVVGATRCLAELL